MEIPITQLPPGDPHLVDAIVGQLKSKGIFDKFRKECLADVDTKPAFLNLRQRVDGQVKKYLEKQTWKNELNKNQLRDSVRKNIQESGILDSGIDAIINQVVNPKIKPLILPLVEDTVYNFLQIERPKREIQEYDVPLHPPPMYDRKPFYGVEQPPSYPPYPPYGEMPPPIYGEERAMLGAVPGVPPNWDESVVAQHEPKDEESSLASESEVSIEDHPTMDEDSQPDAPHPSSDVVPMETDVISSEDDDILARTSPVSDKNYELDTELLGNIKMQGDNAVDSFDGARNEADSMTSAVEKLKIGDESVKSKLEVESRESEATGGVGLLDRRSLDSISSNTSGLSLSPSQTKSIGEDRFVSPSVESKMDSNRGSMEDVRSSQSTPLVDEKIIHSQSISSEDSKVYETLGSLSDAPPPERLTLASFTSYAEGTDSSKLIMGASPVSAESTVSQGSCDSSVDQTLKTKDIKVPKAPKSEEGEITSSNSSSGSSNSPEPSMVVNTDSQTKVEDNIARFPSSERSCDKSTEERSPSYQEEGSDNALKSPSVDKSSKDENVNIKLGVSHENQQHHENPEIKEQRGKDKSGSESKSPDRDERKPSKPKTDDHSSYRDDRNKHRRKDYDDDKDRGRGRDSHGSHGRGSSSAKSTDTKDRKDRSHEKSDSHKSHHSKSHSSSHSKSHSSAHKSSKHDYESRSHSKHHSSSHSSKSSHSVKHGTSEDKSRRPSHDFDGHKDSKNDVDKVSKKDSLKNKIEKSTEKTKIDKQNKDLKEEKAPGKESDKAPIKRMSDRKSATDKIKAASRIEGKPENKSPEIKYETKDTEIKSSLDNKIKTERKESPKPVVDKSRETKQKPSSFVRKLKEDNIFEMHLCNIKKDAVLPKPNEKKLNQVKKPDNQIKKLDSNEGKTIKEEQPNSTISLSVKSFQNEDNTKSKILNNSKDSPSQKVSKSETRNAFNKENIDEGSTEIKSGEKIGVGKLVNNNVKKNNTTVTGISKLEKEIVNCEEKNTRKNKEISQKNTSSQNETNLEDVPSSPSPILKKVTIPLFSMNVSPKVKKSVPRRSKNINSKKLKSKSVISDTDSSSSSTESLTPCFEDLFDSSDEDTDFEGFLTLPKKFSPKKRKPKTSPVLSKPAKKRRSPLVVPRKNVPKINKSQLVVLCDSSDSSDMEVSLINYCQKGYKMKQSEDLSSHKIKDFEGFGKEPEFAGFSPNPDQKLRAYLSKVTWDSSFSLDDFISDNSEDEEAVNQTVFYNKNNTAPSVIDQIKGEVLFTSESELDIPDHAASVAEVISNLELCNSLASRVQRSPINQTVLSRTSDSDSRKPLKKRKVSATICADDDELIPQKCVSSERVPIVEFVAKDIVMNSYSLLTPEDDRTSAKEYEVDLNRRATSYSPLSPSSDASAEELLKMKVTKVNSGDGDGRSVDSS